jgi:hypothetical protein
MMHPSFICGDDSLEERRCAKFVNDATKKPLSEGIKKLVIRWNRCFEVEGDYVEKQC